jgi:hypothetical protein
VCWGMDVFFPGVAGLVEGRISMKTSVQRQGRTCVPDTNSERTSRKDENLPPHLTSLTEHESQITDIRSYTVRFAFDTRPDPAGPRLQLSTSPPLHPPHPTPANLGLVRGRRQACQAPQAPPQAHQRCDLVVRNVRSVTDFTETRVRRRAAECRWMSAKRFLALRFVCRFLG